MKATIITTENHSLTIDFESFEVYGKNEKLKFSKHNSIFDLKKTLKAKTLIAKLNDEYYSRVDFEKMAFSRMKYERRGNSDSIKGYTQLRDITTLAFIKDKINFEKEFLGG